MTDEPIDTPADLLATEPVVTVPPARVVERRDVPDEPIAAWPPGAPWSELECLIAGALSTEPPYRNEHPSMRLPLARQLLDIVSEWEPSS